MIKAIIDLGSNTIRMCVYEMNQDSFQLLFEKKTMAGLANFVKDDKLSRQGIEKAGEILNDYKEILDNFQVDEGNTHVFATASLRNIDNTAQVIEIMKDMTGYSIELLSGKEEATLDFIGATHSVSVKEGIVVDIGGGSTELVAFRENEILFAVSMPIGSLNLYVKNVSKIIPKKEERNIIKQTVLEQLQALDIASMVIPTICGVGGTIRAASKLNNRMFHMPGNNINIEISHIKELLTQFTNSHRKTITPVLQNIPDRIHTIIPGMIILDTIADYFHSEMIMVSKYGIREGYLYERIIRGDAG